MVLNMSILIKNLKFLAFQRKVGQTINGIIYISVNIYR